MSHNERPQTNACSLQIMAAVYCFKTKYKAFFYSFNHWLVKKKKRNFQTEYCTVETREEKLHKSVQKLGGGLAQNWGTCAPICVTIMLSHLVILDKQRPLQSYPHKSCQFKTFKTHNS